MTQLRSRYQKATRDIDELNEQIDKLKLEINTLRSRPSSKLTNGCMFRLLTSSMFASKVRQSSGIAKILSETQDLDDDDLDNTFTSHHNTGSNGGGLSLNSGANGSLSSLSTISSNKESPTS
ncbi:hypothetical protein BpHYR1_021311 [Brachionus plicatilis]|uniref:Uncharacterized protein n=1 Tax=Brachionus plicatilis TaxID=10195 RepID=A0A3M7P6N4_BRAPC|nr:hypothetical protein BpHYR1_021311 [Brachionus plicatilis]